MSQAASSAAEAVKLLRVNACAQIAVSSVFGTLMLLPMQPWFPWKASGKTMREMMAVHLDWYMLAFMQCAAASLIQHHLTLSSTDDASQTLICAKLLMFGGWMNPSAYFFRGIGIDAFVIDIKSSLSQKLAVALGAVSATSILLAWGGLFRIVLKEQR